MDNNNNKRKIQYSSKLYQSTNYICPNNFRKNALKKLLQYEIEVNSIENLLRLNNKESTQIGIYEEKLLTLFLKFNKMNLTNIHFVDENRLEVEELYQFINSKYDLYDKN